MNTLKITRRAALAGGSALPVAATLGTPALADGHGNSAPRFHVTWGTGPGVVAPFARSVREAQAAGRLTYRPRHRVTGLTIQSGAATGVSGERLAEDGADRGASTNRQVIGEFSAEAGAVVLTTGGIGGNHDLVRAHWPVDRLGPAPKTMVAGVLSLTSVPFCNRPVSTPGSASAGCSQTITTCDPETQTTRPS